MEGPSDVLVTGISVKHARGFSGEQNPLQFL